MSKSSSEYDSERDSNPSLYDEEDVSFYHQTEINMMIKDKYKIIEKLGSGRFSRVWKVLNIEDDNHYALKIYKSSKDYDDYYKNEIQVFTILGDDVPSTVLAIDSNNAIVRFENPIRSITPGQPVVFFNGHNVLGGGIIERHIQSEETAIESSLAKI